MNDLQAFHAAHRISRLFVCALAVLAAAFAGSPAARAGSGDELQEVMKLTGLDTAFDNTGTAMVAAMKQNIGKFSDDPSYREKVLIALQPAASAAFSPDKLRQKLRLALESNLNKADYGAILAFYRTPLGIRMTELENAAHAPDAQAKIIGQARELMEMLKNQPERVEALKALDSSLRLTDAAVGLAFNMGRATAVGMAAADEKTESLSEDGLRAMDAAMEKARPGMAAQMKQTLWLVLAYTYRDASVAELRGYVKFLSSPAGKRLYDTVTAAMSQVLVEAGSDFGHALMKELGKEHA